MTVQRVLVTGANGFVGRALCAALTRDGVPVSAAVRSAAAAAGLPCPGIAVGDIGPQTDWSSALAGVDAIAHLAARTHVLRDPAADPLAEYRRTNVDASVCLARQAVAAGVGRIVFLSSIKVNGEFTRGHAFTEQDTPRPEDPYGLSKLEAEQRLAALCTGTQTRLNVLRPPLLYGPGVKGNLLALIRAIERGVPLPLGAIHNRRTLLGIDSLIAAIRLCLEHPRAGDGTFLVGDDRPVSSADIARAIGRALNRRARIVAVPVTLLRWGGALLGRSAAIERLTSSLEVDSSAIRERLGWRPACSFQQGIDAMVKGYLAQTKLE
ncbi:MAG: NAD-dependent epimerase/dehydratase family protein [Betaproteobacteria bacterium]|nr:MAG: NAD-dependent epimerase/dehydratase family protein [Betaproteobacteria bacterium]